MIEDDYDAEFRYDRDPVGERAGPGAGPGGADRHGQQVAGARRCGWAGSSARRRWPTRSRDEKTLADRGSPGLDQLALAALLESGRYDRHLRRMRKVYAGSAERAGRRAGRSTPRPSG